MWGSCYNHPAALGFCDASAPQTSPSRISALAVFAGFLAALGGSGQLLAASRLPSPRQLPTAPSDPGGPCLLSNDSDEHSWLASEFSKDKYSYSGDTNPGDPDDWINVWIGGEFDEQAGSWKWTSNDEWGANGFQGVGANDPGIGEGVGTDNVNTSIHNKLLAHFNHNKDENQYTRHGDGPGTYYWSASSNSSNNTRGIAEVPICNESLLVLLKICLENDNRVGLKQGS